METDNKYKKINRLKKIRGASTISRGYFNDH